MQRELVGGRSPWSPEEAVLPCRTTRSRSITLRFTRSSRVAVTSSLPTLGPCARCRRPAPAAAGAPGSRAGTAPGTESSARGRSGGTATRPGRPPPPASADSEDAPQGDLDARPHPASGWPRPASCFSSASAAASFSSRLLRRLAERRGRERDRGPRRTCTPGSGSIFISTLASGSMVHRAPQRPVRPRPHLVTGHTLGEMDGHAHVARLDGRVLADELPVQLRRVGEPLGGALGDVLHGEDGGGVGDVEVELHGDHAGARSSTAKVPTSPLAMPTIGVLRKLVRDRGRRVAGGRPGRADAR